MSDIIVGMIYKHQRAIPVKRSIVKSRGIAF